MKTIRLSDLLTMDYDAYERHSVVSRLLRIAKLPANARVLDVGGRANLLQRFASYAVIALNVDTSGDVLYGGGNLPFADDACEAVVSLDTLEHLPRVARLSFLRECLRVASEHVVVAAPWGSAGHNARERELAVLYHELHGKSHIYLSEHVRYGLPGATEIADWLSSLPVREVHQYFAGDYVWQARHFERATRLWAQSSDSVWARVRHLLIHLGARAVFHPVRVRTAPEPHTNRFYLVLEK